MVLGSGILIKPPWADVPWTGELLHKLAVVQYVVVCTSQLLLELADVQKVIDVYEASQLAQDSHVLGHVE